jgi:regulator of sigma E protease
MRGGQKMKLMITPESIEQNGEVYGRIGAGVSFTQAQLDSLLVTQHFGFVDALIKSFEKTWDTTVFSLRILGNMLLGNVSVESLSGPVTIANYAGQSANMGLKVFIGFLALVSISIGVLNLLPIPILDGGHLMYYMFEFFTGKPASEFAIVWGQKIGFFILILTMTLAIYNDLNRLVTG